MSRDLKSADAIIIGAGVTGLVAALRLREANLDSIREIVVLEKQSVPGGLLQSTTQDGYWWDNGAFSFNRSNYLVNLFPDIFKKIEDKSVKVRYKADFHKYPFSLPDYIKSQSTYAIVKTAMSYICACVRSCFCSKPANLHDWLRCGLPDRLLSEIQLDTYLKKTQGTDTINLSPSLGERRLKGVRNSGRPGWLIKRIFRNVYSSKPIKKKPRWHPFEPGVGAIARKLAQHCEDRNIRIVYNTAVQKIENKPVTKIYCDGNHGRDCYQAPHVISTMPLNELVEALVPQVTDECRSFAKSLSFMDMQVVLFVINRPAIMNKCLTVYSFEEHHKWKRLVARSLQNGLSSILVEVPFDPGNGEPAHDIIDRVSNDLTAELGLFEPDEILFKHMTVVHNAYPVYKIGFESKVAAIIQEIESDRFVTAGRQGLFQWFNSDGAIQTAIAAADRIINVASNPG